MSEDTPNSAIITVYKDLCTSLWRARLLARDFGPRVRPFPEEEEALRLECLELLWRRMTLGEKTRVTAWVEANRPEARPFDSDGYPQTPSPPTELRVVPVMMANGEWAWFQGDPDGFRYVRQLALANDERCIKWNCVPGDRKRCGLPNGHPGDCDFLEERLSATPMKCYLVASFDATATPPALLRIGVYSESCNSLTLPHSVDRFYADLAVGEGDSFAEAEESLMRFVDTACSGLGWVRGQLVRQRAKG